jgi:uncharacterized protein
MAIKFNIFMLVLTLFAITFGVVVNNNAQTLQTTAPDADIIIVGAGISGLCAALEAGRGNAKVLVIDMFSVFGGAGVMSQGGICLIDSPVQRAIGIKDNQKMAFKDFMEYGECGNKEWVKYYVNNSVSEIYDWIVAMGVTFEEVWLLPGDSVPRFHNIKGRGLGLVGPIYRECIKNPNIRFIWNTEVKNLLIKDVRVVGVVTQDIRTNNKKSYIAPVVILATGGFQSNLDMVRENWPKEAPFPDRILIGSGINSSGSGHRLAYEAGARLSNLDHQWNYVMGLPDPRSPGTNRGLNVKNMSAIWVNAQGRRFTCEYDSPKKNFPMLVAQKPATYWAVFDENSKRNFFVSGSHWADFNQIEKEILNNPDLVKTSSTIEGLAGLAELPEKALAETVQRYNEMVDKGIDLDFGRFGPTLSYKPNKIIQPPFYAVQLFPLTRKSMGGVVIDMSCRVLDQSEHVIPGLYAVGELTGQAGVNGNAAIEGTFLGMCIITGRIAGRSVLSELKIKSEPCTVSNGIPSRSTPVQAESSDCMACHDMELLLEQSRPGYWHFNKSHRVVQERKDECLFCHPELYPYQKEKHQISPLSQFDSCAICHGVDR